MKREDLRKNIIPTTIGNTDASQENGNKKFDTTDLIWIDSVEEQFNNNCPDEQRRVSASDYAIMNYAYVSNRHRTDKGAPTAWLHLRSAWSKEMRYCMDNEGKQTLSYVHDTSCGLCPCLHYKIPSDPTARTKLKIREVKDKDGNVIDHTLHIGEYAGKKASEKLSTILENLYHGGKPEKELIATGLWYSENGSEKQKEYAGKHSPIFKYKRTSYARVISNPCQEEINYYSDGIECGEAGTVRWAKVEPIPCIIKNWEEMPKEINPNGNGKAEFFDLRMAQVVIANFPFYPIYHDDNSSMWQNSTPRGFLNGIDVRNITSNGNSEFSAKNRWRFFRRM